MKLDKTDEDHGGFQLSHPTPQDRLIQFSQSHEATAWKGQHAALYSMQHAWVWPDFREHATDISFHASGTISHDTL